MSFRYLLTPSFPLCRRLGNIVVKCVKTVEEALDSRYGPQESFKSRLGKYLGDLMELGDNISVTLTL